ncbi:MAG: hypothetical protein V7K95_19150, partial [Nostoc sp.]
MPSLKGWNKGDRGIRCAIAFELWLGNLLGLEIEKYLKLPSPSAEKTYISICVCSFPKSAHTNIFPSGQT